MSMAFAVGGNHVTMDVARGLGITLADAERLKTLYGACLTSVSDESETIAVVQVGEEGERPVHLPKAQLISIIKPRVEEILELVRDRLKTRRSSRTCRATACSYRRRLPAHRDAGGGETNRFRAGPDRPSARVSRDFPKSAKSPAFAAAIGLLVYPQVSGIEHFRPARRALPSGRASARISRAGGADGSKVVSKCACGESKARRVF